MNFLYKVLENSGRTFLVSIFAVIIGVYIYYFMNSSLLPSSPSQYFAVTTPLHDSQHTSFAKHISKEYRTFFKKKPCQFHINRKSILVVANVECHFPDRHALRRLQDALKSEFKKFQPKIYNFENSYTHVLTLGLSTQTDSFAHLFHTAQKFKANLEEAISGIHIALTYNDSLYAHNISTLQSLSSGTHPLFRLKATLEGQAQFRNTSYENPIYPSPYISPRPVKGGAPQKVMVSLQSQGLYGSHPVVTLEVHFHKGLNTIKTRDLFFEKASHLLQKNINLITIKDSAEYIKISESNVIKNLFIGILLTMLGVYVFQKSSRSTFLVACSIPFSFCLTIPVLYAMGIERNVMSLAGMALGTGLVVDATVSILDQIDLYFKQGKSIIAATLAGLQKNALSVLMTVTTTLTVFVPILFIPKSIGYIFQDLAYSIIVTQIMSYLSATLLVPSVNIFLHHSLSLKKQDVSKEIKLPSIFQVLFRHKIYFMSVSFCLVIIFFSLLAILPGQEFLPKSSSHQLSILIEKNKKFQLSEISKVFRVHAAMEKELHLQNLITYLEKEDQIRMHVSHTAPDEIKEYLVHQLPELNIHVNQKDPLQPQFENDEYYIFYLDSGNLYSEKFISLINKWDIVETVRSSSRRRQKTEAYPNTEGFLRDVRYRYQHGTHLYGKPAKRHFNLSHNIVATESLIPLSTEDPSHLAETYHSTTSHQYQGSSLFQAVVSLNNATTTQFHERVTALSQKLGVPIYHEVNQKKNAMRLYYLRLCLIAAVIICSIILLFHNKSLVNTSIILMTILWGLAGAIPGLLIHAETINASSILGFILLAGTVVNNGILLTDTVSRLREAQNNIYTSCIEAVKMRVTPLLVTNSTTILGMLPMVFETGAGSQLYRGLAIIVVYGSAIGTPLSLVGIPSALMLSEYILNNFWKFLLKLKVKYAAI